MTTDMSAVVLRQDTENQILTQMLAQFKVGIAITSGLPVYTVAALPATAPTGQLAFASNGRKPGEGGGAGTGITVFWNGATSTWFTTLGVVVTS
jgi:hypothetical protein